MIVNSVNFSSGGGELEYIPITTYAELISAFAASNAKPLRLMNDLTATAEITTTATNTLDLHGHAITGTNAFRFMTINSGGNVTLCDSNVNGGGTIKSFGVSAKSGGVALIKSGGAFTIYSGTISNCTGEYGGAVCAYPGTFTMYGGTISNCTGKYGGAVNAYADGTFTMYGGTISNCTASQHGGGANDESRGKFTMSGGSITNCNASGGGGVATSRNTFTMSGGIICMNTATSSCGGVSGTYTKTGGYVGGNTPQE